MSNIKIGWSEASIVPKGRKVDLVGQFYERISDEVETPIAINALAIECGEDAAIFCSCDLVGTSEALINEAKKRLPENFPKDKLIVNAIHTHTSLGYAKSNDTFNGSLNALNEILGNEFDYNPLVKDESQNVLRETEALDFLAERLAFAALEAWESRKTGAYAPSFGRAAIGMCRRVCYDDGSAKMWGDTNSASFTELESGNDSGIELLFTFDDKKRLTGVVANIACPSQVLEHQSFISSDYMGKVKALIRERYGDNVGFLGLISPAGDMCPRDMIRWVDAEIKLNDPNIYREKIIAHRADPSMFDIKGCNLVAKRVANEIFWALDEVTEYVTDTTLVHKTLNIDLPLRRVTPSEYQAAYEKILDFKEKSDGRINYEDKATMHVHSGTIARFRLQQTKDIFTIESHVLKLGDIAFATNPFELFLNYGNQIRARSLAKQTFLIQLCQGSYGYLPTEKAECGSHYSAYVSSGVAGHVGGEMLVRKTLAEINEMFDK